MRVMSVTTSSVALLVSALAVPGCGSGTEGPPPRYAEAPPEEHPQARQTPPPDAPPPVEPDAGTVAVADAGATTPDADGGAPAQPLSATRPLTQEQWDAMLATGRRKFNGVCGGCHGTGIGPTLNGRHKTAEAVRRQIRRGAGDMRPISERRLSNDEMEAVLVFLSTIRAVIDVHAPGQAAPS